MPALSFWHLVDQLNDIRITLRVKSFNLPTIALILRMKLRQGMSNHALSAMMNANEWSIWFTFWLACMVHYTKTNYGPRIWTRVNLSNELKNQQYRKLHEEASPFHKEYAAKFKDPLNKGRKGVFVLFDSSKVN